MAIPKLKLGHIVILIAMSLLIYSNSLDCSWHLDDDQNIVTKDSLHLSEFTFSAIKQTFFSYGGDRISRSVPCFTFALNYYFGGLNVFGYHLVNIFIHILTSVFLYLVMLQMLSINESNRRHVKHKYEIALLASLLWAACPINVQAVTYIVQRMASLAALFSIVSVYLYLLFRFKKKWKYMIGCIVSFALAFLSKENAVLLPFSILLIELVFFRKINIKDSLKAIPVFVFCLLVVLVIGVKVFDLNLTHFLNYGNRLFTPCQRILTEFRILVYYLYQIFYPNVSNLSIHHDIVISKSLFSPVTTFFSILFVLSLIGSAISLLKKFPLFSFAVLFYFLNHMVESSFFNLELMFEHRNYLPSFFLFLPLADAALYLMERYQSKSDIVYYSIPTFILLVIVGFGMATYTRNFDWKTERTLWADALEKAPLSSRPLHNLAWWYYERYGDTDKTLARYEKALSLHFYDVYQKSTLLGNIAFIHHRKGNKNEALENMKKAVNENPDYTEIQRMLAFLHISYKEYMPAEMILQKILAENPRDIESIFLYGKLLYLTREYEGAVQQFGKILYTNKKSDVISYLSRSYLKLDLYDKSEFILSLSESKTLAHQLLSIITAHYQNDAQKITHLVEDLYKNKSAFFMKTIQLNPIYKIINQEFDELLDCIFKQKHNMQIQALKNEREFQ